MSSLSLASKEKTGRDEMIWHLQGELLVQEEGAEPLLWVRGRDPGQNVWHVILVVPLSLSLRQGNPTLQCHPRRA